MLISSIVQTRSTADGKAMLEVGGRPFFKLNPVAAAVWIKLSEGLSPQQIIEQLAMQFDAPREQIAKDVNNFVGMLKQNLLVQECAKALDCHAEIVWNKGIAARCDWRIPDEFPKGLGYRKVLNPIGHAVPPNLLGNLIPNPEMYRNIKDGDLVWVRAAWLKSFIEQVLPIISAKFVLITADSDGSMPSQFLAEALELLENSNIVHWFTQNCDGPGFMDRMSPLPIGADFHALSEQPKWDEDVASPQQQEQIFQSIRREFLPARKRIRKVYIDFAWQPPNLYSPPKRQQVLAKVLTNKSFVFQSRPLPRTQLWRKWSEYAFVLSPHGVGLDCHRTWEALACGNIILVPSSPLDILYEGLPVIPMKDWNEITPQKLDAWLDCYSGCEIGEERLTSRYWVNKMRAKAEELLNSAPS